MTGSIQAAITGEFTKQQLIEQKRDNPCLAQAEMKRRPDENNKIIAVITQKDFFFHRRLFRGRIFFFFKRNGFWMTSISPFKKKIHYSLIISHCLLEKRILVP